MKPKTSIFSRLSRQSGIELFYIKKDGFSGRLILSRAELETLRNQITDALGGTHERHP